MDDNVITEKCGFVEMIKEQCAGRPSNTVKLGILADKGFTCFKAFQNVGAELVTPKVLHKFRFNAGDSLFTRRAASARIFVEIAIRSVKTHLRVGVPSSQRTRLLAEHCVFVASLLTNYKLPFQPHSVPNGDGTMPEEWAPEAPSDDFMLDGDEEVHEMVKAVDAAIEEDDQKKSKNKNKSSSNCKNGGGVGGGVDDDVDDGDDDDEEEVELIEKIYSCKCKSGCESLKCACRHNKEQCSHACNCKYCTNRK